MNQIAIQLGWVLQKHGLIKKIEPDFFQNQDSVHQNAELLQGMISISQEIEDDLKSVEFQRTLDWACLNGVQAIFPWQREYPKLLIATGSPPPVLWCLGQLSALEMSSLSVVGSRQPSQEALEWMSWHLREFLNQKSMSIVSGGAIGVDQMAHWTAIRSNRPTLVMLPVGLMSRYPKNLAALEKQVLENQGLIISPFLPNWPLYKMNFGYRNRVIAGLSNVTLVVEARRKSGTLLTAKAAKDIGRKVAVVPCSPLSTIGLGGLDLLYDDCETQLVRDSGDLLALYL